MNQINPQMPPQAAVAPQIQPLAGTPGGAPNPYGDPTQPVPPALPPQPVPAALPLAVPQAAPVPQAPVPPTSPAPQMAPVAQNQEPVDQGVLSNDQGVQFNGFSDDMFDDQHVKFHKLLDGETRFRLLPPYAPKKFYFKADLHWGFTDLEGNKKALTCSKFTDGRCPICEEVDRLKGKIEQYELYKGRPEWTQNGYEAEAEKLGGRIDDIKRKPTYLWNVLTDKGEQKVISLSWNAHKPLEDKIKFFWSQRKINVTDLRANMVIWCSRTGMKVKTRYQYEVLEQTAQAIALVEPVKDLSLTYIQRDYNYLAQVLNSGVAPTPNFDPNDRNFDALGSNAAAVPQATPHQPGVPMSQQLTSAPQASPQAAPVPPMPPAFNAAEPMPTQFAPPTPPQGQTILETMQVANQPSEPLPAPYRADDPATHGRGAPMPPAPVIIPPPTAPQVQQAPVIPQVQAAAMPPAASVVQAVPVQAQIVANIPQAAAPQVQQSAAPQVQAAPPAAVPQAPQVAPLTAQDQSAIGDMMATLQQGVNPT